MKIIFVIAAILMHLAVAGQRTSSPLQAILCDSIQKAFTPNGDNINDIFSIEPFVLHHAQTDSFSLKVFNRWGELVFESNDHKKPWNGKDKKDKPAPTVVYIYLARLSIYNGPSNECKGSITLIR
jgi:gliding motility-associated-like protein